MTDPAMSPAQKVLAAIDACDGESDVTVAVAALRAAADEVVPVQMPVGAGFRQHRSAIAERRENRRQLLAIAVELEAMP